MIARSQFIFRGIGNAISIKKGSVLLGSQHVASLRSKHLPPQGECPSEMPAGQIRGCGRWRWTVLVQVKATFKKTQDVWI